MITGFDFALGADGGLWSALGRRCFFCGEALADPAVVWQGCADEALWLHAECVASLFIRLARDVHEIQKPDYYRRRGLR